MLLDPVEKWFSTEEVPVWLGRRPTLVKAVLGRDYFSMCCCFQYSQTSGTNRRQKSKVAPSDSINFRLPQKEDGTRSFLEPQVFQRSVALQYTKSITVVVKSLFGYGSTLAISILGCSQDMSLWSKVHRESPEKLFCPSQIGHTGSELEIMSLCSPMRCRGAPDVPCDQLLTGWWCLLRETMVAHYKFVTEKCSLKMERQLLAHCYSNRFATTVCKVVSLCPAWATTVTVESGLKMHNFLPFLEAREQQGLTFKKLCLIGV